MSIQMDEQADIRTYVHTYKAHFQWKEHKWTKYNPWIDNSCENSVECLQKCEMLLLLQHLQTFTFSYNLKSKYCNCNNEDDDGDNDKFHVLRYNLQKCYVTYSCPALKSEVIRVFFHFIPVFYMHCFSVVLHSLKVCLKQFYTSCPFFVQGVHYCQCGTWYRSLLFAAHSLKVSTASNIQSETCWWLQILSLNFLPAQHCRHSFRFLAWLQRHFPHNFMIKQISKNWVLLSHYG